MRQCYDKDGSTGGFDWQSRINGELIERKESDDEREERREETLHCKVCNHCITRVKDRTLVGGRHLYTFTNPLGVTYQIGCFQAAKGCLPEGPSCVEHTWFPGYSWQIQRCSSCGVHMGWRFQGDDSAFFGLVLTQLVERGE